MTTDTRPYAIDTGDGRTITAGITSYARARKLAQQEANDRGEAVTIYRTPARDEGESGEVIEPEEPETSVTLTHHDRRRPESMATQPFDSTTTIVIVPDEHDVFDVARHMETAAQRSCLIVRAPAIQFWSDYDWYNLCNRIGCQETLLVIGPGVLERRPFAWLAAPFDAPWGERDLANVRDRLGRLASAVTRLNPGHLPYATPAFPGLEVWSGKATAAAVAPA